MFVINTTVWAFLLGIPMYGLRGGSGMLLFSAIFVSLFGLLVEMAAPGLTRLYPDAPFTVAGTQLVIFIALSIAAFPLGSYANRFVQINLDPFDWVLGFVFGTITAVVATHFFLSYVLLVYQGTPLFGQLEHSFIVRQVVYFDGWHQLSGYLGNLGSTSRVITVPE